MYQVSVTTQKVTKPPIHGDDIDGAVKALRDALLQAAAPGRRVMWVVHGPAGPAVRGDITINAFDAHRTADVDQHVADVRHILAALAAAEGMATLEKEDGSE